MNAEELLAGYGALVREYHQTLDLLSPQALRDWDTLLADALLYGEIAAQLAPEADAIVDVGSGVGLPGIPLAITSPGMTVHLVERRRRRAAFLNLARGRLDLDNLNVHHGDVADLAGFKVGTITAQAVGRFASIHELTRKLHAPEVLLISSKGDDWQLEADELVAASGAELLATAVRGRKGATGHVVGLLLAGGNACR